MTPRRLCRVEDVPEGGGRGFRFRGGDKLDALFVVKHRGTLYAYANSCPHLGTPLDTFPDRFFERDGKRLLCTTHGALFRVEDGHCLSGPCEGKRLTAIAIRVEGGEILLDDRE